MENLTDINTDWKVLNSFKEGEKIKFESNPLAVELGLEIKDVKNGSVYFECSPGVTFTQGRGFIQGGIISAMLDYAMAFSALATVNPCESIVTTSMSTNFMRPAPVGRYLIYGDIEKKGRTMIFAKSSIFTEDKKLVATSSSTISILK